MLTSKRRPIFWIHRPALLHDADGLPRAVPSDILHVRPAPRFNVHYQLLLTGSIYKTKRSLSWALRSCSSQAGRWQNLDKASLPRGRFQYSCHIQQGQNGPETTSRWIPLRRWSNSILVSADERENSQQSWLLVEQMEYVNKANATLQIFIQRQIRDSACLGGAQFN